MRTKLISGWLLVLALQFSMVAVGADKSAFMNAADRHCGAKCLYVLLRQFGTGPTTYKELRRTLGEPGKEGYSLLQLRDSARVCGLYAECMKLTPAELQLLDAKTSAIAHLNAGHFVVLGQVGPSHVSIHDTSNARNGCISLNDLSREWSGNVLLVSKSEITLRRADSGLARLLGVSFLAIAAFGFAIVGYRKFRGGSRLTGVLLLSFLPVCLLGCNTESGSQDLHLRSSIGLPSQSLNVGTIQQHASFEKVKVPLRNLGHKPLVFAKSNVSCACLRVVEPTGPIEPSQTAEFEFYLDCRTTGPRTATYSFSSTDDQHAEITVSWIVTDGITVTPTSITDVDLFNGDSVSKQLQLSSAEEDLRVEVLPRKKTNDLEIVTQLSDGVCQVDFKALAEATPEILAGEICFFKAGQSNPLAIVPYIARIHNLIDFSPRKLYFHKSDGQFTAQLVLTSSQAAIDEEIGLFWSDGEQVRSYEVEEAGDNMRIIDIATKKPAATQSHLLVKIGSLTRELPVDFTE